MTHNVKLCVSDVLQHSADRLSQAAEASPGFLFCHAGHPGWANQDHPVQKPPCRRLLWLVTGSCHRCLSGNSPLITNIIFAMHSYLWFTRVWFTH